MVFNKHCLIKLSNKQLEISNANVCVIFINFNNNIAFKFN